jgi:hypothetical protein
LHLIDQLGLDKENQEGKLFYSVIRVRALWSFFPIAHILPFIREMIPHSQSKPAMIIRHIGKQEVDKLPAYGIAVRFANLVELKWLDMSIWRPQRSDWGAVWRNLDLSQG